MASNDDLYRMYLTNQLGFTLAQTTKLSLADLEALWLAAAGAWITPALLNGVTNFGNGFASFGYKLAPDGSLQLRGLVTNAATANNPMFQLPAGFIPPTSVSNSTVATNQFTIVAGLITLITSSNTVIFDGYKFPLV